MQNYQEKPIPLVFRQHDGKYTVNPEALELFLSIEGKLAIISVAGVYRTGKSYLLNKMLLNKKEGFAVGPTVNPETKGIWVWGKPLIFKNKEQEIINVLVLDSEGLGSTEEDINHDLRLFSITLLMSSSFLYNTVGAVDENALDSLGLVLRLCEHLKNQNFNDFPDFNWILRDFSLALRDKNGEPLTPQEYLESCLSNQSGDSQVRNKIRQSIKKAFLNRNCYAFVRPLLDESSLQNLDSMELQELRPEFVEQVIEFRKFIYNNLKVKSIKGREIKGSVLCELIKIYVDCINSDKIPVIESGWEQLCLKEVHEMIEEIEEAIAERVKQLRNRKLPRTRKELLAEQESLMEEFQQIFRKRLANNSKADEYFGTVEELINKNMKGIQEEMKIVNSQETQSFVKKEFDNIEKKIKNSQFKNMGQLVKQFQIFYEYFRKKCPYKDEIQTGLELMLKKFSDSSLVMYKAMQTKKDANIEDLNNQIRKINADFTLKQEKLKSDRMKLQDKVAKLETNFQEIKSQNSEMSKSIEHYQQKLYELQNQSGGSHEEELEKQNLFLKKKVMQIEQNKQDLLCEHNSQLNALKQQILLKANEVQNYKKISEEVNDKIMILEDNWRTSKEQSAIRICQLVKQLENVSHEKCVIEKSLKDKLDEKEREIQKLENAFEAKCEEISQLNFKNSLETSMISEQALLQEKKIIEEKTKQISILQRKVQELTKFYENKVKDISTDLNEKQTNFRIKKLELEQEKALISQKIDFMQKQSTEKNNKNKLLQQQISKYVDLFQEKDNQIFELESELEEFKAFSESQNEQITLKIKEMAEQLEEKNTLICKYEQEIEKYENQDRKEKEKMNFRVKELQALNEKYEQNLKKMENSLTHLQNQKQEMENKTNETIELLKQQHNRDRQDQKRNAELSLVQLKNFYEIQKQRLEKRILEERKKFEYTQANKVMQLTNQYSKDIKKLTDQNSQLTQKLEDVEEQLMKTQNQYEVKMLGMEEDLESEKKAFENRIEIMKKRSDQVTEELNQVERQYEEDRITFVKKIEGLNFEISKKEKQILQLNVKKQSLEGTITKKQNQIESLKKTMHQQIQGSLKKVSEVQAKYQKVNEEFVQFKIQAQKQNALCKQRNQFLNARLSELGREKQIGSLKNIEKLDRQKINELKQQLQKQKTENISLQAKIQNLRRNEKDSINTHKKQFNQVQKDNMYLQQKNQLNETKIRELEAKIQQRSNNYVKDIEDLRIKNQEQRNKLQGDIDNLKDKLTLLEDEKNQVSWKYQKQIALISDRIKYAEYQRDQNKKQLEETEKRLQSTLAQLKRNNEKGLDESGVGKRQSLDKRYSNQMQLMKMSSKVRQEELEESNKKMKEELKQYRQKMIEYEQKVTKAQKSLIQEKSMSEEIERMKKEKENEKQSHKRELAKEMSNSRAKLQQLQKKNREFEKKNNQFLFILEKEKAKSSMEKEGLLEKIKELQETLTWQRRKNSPRNKTESIKGKRFSSTLSNFSDWK